MKKILMILAIASLAACSNTTGNQKLDTKTTIDAQMRSAKDKAAVQSMYGAPDLTFQQDGGDVYEYKKVDGSGRYNWLIPVWGWFAAYWQDDYAYRATSLFVYFDNTGNVKNWNVVETSGTTN